MAKTSDYPDAVAVNRWRGLILLDTDEVIFVEAMTDAWGEETEDPDEAEFLIAQLPDGNWISVDLSHFEKVRTQ